MKLKTTLYKRFINEANLLFNKPTYNFMKMNVRYDEILSDNAADRTVGTLYNELR